jgi:cell shape-determining protein MreC
MTKMNKSIKQNLNRWVDYIIVGGFATASATTLMYDIQHGSTFTAFYLVLIGFFFLTTRLYRTELNQFYDLYITESTGYINSLKTQLELLREIEELKEENAKLKENQNGQ